VAFAQGGTEPTITDAQLVLGRIAARALSGGVSLDAEAAARSLATLAGALRSDVAATAQAIVDIADAGMARALRRVSVERGVDPRDCALVAFGGGGPLHACALADALSIPIIIVPPLAGVLSAVGLALAPERHDAAMSLLERVDALAAERIAEAVQSLAARVQGAERRTLARMRFVGQGHELEVPVESDDEGTSLGARFVEAHRARYGFALPQPVEVVALRHTAGEPARVARFVRDRAAAPWDAAARVDSGGPAPDARVVGPATIALPDATLWVAEGWAAQALEIGGWRLTREERP
jgi:N-methylhydantoinase A